MRGTRARAIRKMQNVCLNQVNEDGKSGHVVYRIMSAIKQNKEGTIRIRHARCVCDAHIIARVK